MSIRFLSIRAFGPAACLVSLLAITVTPSFAQPTAPATQPAAQTPAPATKTPAAPASTTKVPDYPDPRGLFIGVYGLSPLSSSGPDVRGGVAAGTNYESLYGIGKAYRFVPLVEAGIPVTRTGMLYADIEQYHGDGSQVLTQGTFVNAMQYNTGDTVTTRYHILTGRVYLDDLLYPHKFPVSRLRFKSIWGLRYLSITQSQISPTEDDVSGTPGSSFGVGDYFILYPEFGAAMEYAVAPHVLFRVDGAGFAIPHHSTIGETGATLSYRKNNLEILVGLKTLHFKTTPKKEEYIIGNFISPSVGLRWYF